MKTLAVLVLCLALVIAPYTVKVELGAYSNLPWKTFSESVSDAVAVRPGMCNGEQILTATLERDGKVYTYFTAENGRYVFAEMSADMVPVRIYVGVQLPSPQHDVIKVLDEHPFSEDRDGAGPCGHLFPQRT